MAHGFESVSLLLLNGGIGARVGTSQPKQLLRVQGLPILVYSLVAADQVPEINEIVLNYPVGWEKEVRDVIRDYAIETPIKIVSAGETRHESVAAMVPMASNDVLLIHESARPLVHGADFANLISAPGENVSYMLPIPFTVAPVDPSTRKVTGSLDRDKLRNVQLPQKFVKDQLLRAHEWAQQERKTFTEDATLMVEAGYDVEFMNGSDENFKVTSPIDVRLASFLMQESEVEDE